MARKVKCLLLKTTQHDCEVNVPEGFDEWDIDSKLKWLYQLYESNPGVFEMLQRRGFPSDIKISQIGKSSFPTRNKEEIFPG